MRPPLGRLRGFTLVEMLIALALLSLLMLVLTGAMRAMSQTSEGVERRVAAADDYRVATGLLESVLGSVSVRRMPRLDTSDPARALFFEAGPNALAWIGVMPARYGVGGRHYLRLALEGSQLVLRYAPWNGASAFSDWASASAQVLAEPVTGLHLRYQEPDSLQWLPAWPPAGLRPNVVLPLAIEVSIDGLVPSWPPLVVAPHALAATDPTNRRGDWGA